MSYICYHVYISRQHTRARENRRKTTPEATEMAPIFSVYFPFSSSYLFGFVSYSLLLKRQLVFLTQCVIRSRPFFIRIDSLVFLFPEKIRPSPVVTDTSRTPKLSFPSSFDFYFLLIFKLIFDFLFSIDGPCAGARARALPFETKQSPAAS